MAKKFGQFPSLGAFLASYKAAQEKKFNSTLKGLSVENQVKAMADRRSRERDVVEVRSTLHVREEDDTDAGSHYHLLIFVDEILETDPDVNDDVQKCMDERTDVFVAVRYGDAMGIPDEITGLEPDAKLRLRGEWIPKEKAYAHGGEKRSVLHFTHRPLGFICVEETCYQ